MSLVGLQLATPARPGRESRANRTPEDEEREAHGNTRRESGRGISSLLLGSLALHEGLRPSIRCSPLGTRGDQHLRRVTRRIRIRSRHPERKRKGTERCAVLDATQSARERHSRNSAPEEGRM